MQIIKETLPQEKTSYIEPIMESFKGKKLIMFDIETTGLSALSSFTYIIGYNTYEDGEWTIYQLYNDDGHSEPEMIQHFMDLLPEYDYLYEFNGDRFDIPYIQQRISLINRRLRYGLTDNFSRIQSCDLMKMIRPYKSALGLPNIKQKTIEKYLGIDRDDQYNGGQLIDVYLSYLADHDDYAKDLVLLHNRDDMEGMIHLMKIKEIQNLTSPKNLSIQNLSTKELNGCLYLTLQGLANAALPHEIISHVDNLYFSVAEGQFVLKVPIENRELKIFYNEKSSDSHTSFYIPISPLDVELMNYLPIYKETAKRKMAYIELTDKFLSNAELVSIYAAGMIGVVLRGKL